MVDTSISEVNLSNVFGRKVETIKNSEPTFDERSIIDNRIVDMELFAAVVHMLGCPFCKNTRIILQEDQEKKKGLASLLTVKCTSCDFCTVFYTSRSYHNTFDIDTRAAAYSMRAIGQGYAGLESLTSLMNLPKPVTANNYDKLIYRLVKTTKVVADITMQDTCEKLRADSSSDAIKDVEVSSDGTWQHRGYSSLNGVVTVISIKNGKALDIEPMSRACKACVLKEPFKKTDPLAFEEWKTSHVCKLNHSGSAGNMEPVGAKRIWERSLQKNKLR